MNEAVFKLEEERMETERQLIRKQLRSGASTSFKKTVLSMSPWEIGPLGEVESAKEEVGFYRIIGAPLPPRHNESQLWDNLKYILAAEPKTLERCRKIFVLNRLDSKLEREVQTYIEARGYEVVKMPLDIDNEYKPFQAEDYYGLPDRAWNPHLVPKFKRMNARLYVMNNNGARNFALRLGLKRGWAWTLPFDGNCMFDEVSWAAFLKVLDASRLSGAAYVALPLMRTTFNGSALVPVANPGEHQVAFNRRAKLQFDPTIPYGHRPKVNLLWRLGVPGHWSHWNGDAPFRTEGLCKLTRAKECQRTTPLLNEKEARKTAVAKTVVVYRLPDGIGRATSQEQRANLDKRAELRDAGATNKINSVDALSSSGLPEDDATKKKKNKPASYVKPLFLNSVSMESMRRECHATRLLFKPFVADVDEIVFLSEKARALDDPFLSQRKKTFLAVGAIDQHHCAQMRDLLLLADRRIQEDEDSSLVTGRHHSRNHHHNRGHRRILEEEEDEEDSEQERVHAAAATVAHTMERVVHQATAAPHHFAAPRSREVMSNITLQALAFFYSGEPRYAEKAAASARAWFVVEKSDIYWARFSSGG